MWVTMRLDCRIHARKTRRAFGSTPYRHRESSTRAKNAPCLCKRPRLIRDMAHAQIGDHEIKFGIEKRKVLRVRFNEGCGLSSLPREREHCRRKIHPDDLAATAQNGFGNVALTAAQIERLETAIGAGRVQQAF